MSGVISAKVLADSVSPQDVRLTTLEVKFPRCILAEFNTHRQLSRNFMSSRAVPVARMIEAVEQNPFVPMSWGANQRGMQAGAEHDAKVYIATEDGTGNLVLSCKDAWLHARDQMVKVALGFAEAGYHKQLPNRLLEPWMFTRGVVTATEWANFFALRCHSDAEPHFQRLAMAMRDAMNSSEPRQLDCGEWHLPYVRPGEHRTLDEAIRCSVARCARVSYRGHDGRPTGTGEDLELYRRLVGAHPVHASPAEHQATPDPEHPELWGNFTGWRQYRKTLPGECAA